MDRSLHHSFSSKRLRRQFGLLAVLTLALLWPALAWAATLAGDSAAAYATWTNGSSGGTGFAPWVLTPASSGSTAGHFVGNSAANGDGDNNGDGDINTAGKAWCMYGNSGNTASAVRGFPATMAVNDIFTLAMDNGFLDNTGTPQPTVGFGLQNASGQNLFEFIFIGGQSNYKTVSGAGTVDTGLAFSDEGLTIAFSLTSPTTYQVTITRLAGGNATLSGSLSNPPGGQSIAQVRLFNANAGSGGSRDACFNSMTLERPTYVELRNFSATALSDTAVQVAWETAVEIDHAGFNVYRSPTPDGALTRVNTVLIASQGTQGQGASYVLTDIVTPGVWYYTLEDIDNYGVATRHGPLAVDVSVPTSVAGFGLDGRAINGAWWWGGAVLALSCGWWVWRRRV